MLAQTLEATPASNYLYEDYDHMRGIDKEGVHGFQVPEVAPP